MYHLSYTFLCLWLALWLPLAAVGQQTSFPYQLELQEVDIPGLGGTQSFAFGQTDTHWLVVGGRLDGLHRRQPWAAFDLAGHNDQLIVVDPADQSHWRRDLSELPAILREQLRATNMVFFQRDDILYLIGGYGYSEVVGDHTTFGAMLALDVPRLVAAVRDNGPLEPHIRRLADDRFAVTGGQIASIYDTYYLAGGQRFEGRYNPHGPNHGPGFLQEYTNEVRRFKLMDTGTFLQVDFLPTYTDTTLFHRRDYNALPQIMPDGTQSMTAFSGVFRPDVDLPFLNAVMIDSSGYATVPDFEQYYNHYHCAKVPLYSAREQQMHNLFFGGIAQYYLDANNNRVEDDEVPFVRTIARVSRSAEGKMSEVVLPLRMPSLLGAGTEFIPQTSLTRYSNGVIDLDQLTADTTLLGYLYGGIHSSGRNIFWVNDGSQSTATSQIFALYLIKDQAVGTQQVEASDFALSVFPNPAQYTFTVQFELPRAASKTSLRLSNLQGQLQWATELDSLPAGLHLYSFPAEQRERLPEGVYQLEVRTPWGRSVRQLLLK